MLLWGGSINILYECKILHLCYLQLFVVIASNVQVKHTHKQHEILHTVGTVNQIRYCSCFVSFFLHGTMVTKIVQDMLVFLWLSILHLNRLLTQNSFKHFSVHKVNWRVCFITKKPSSWCKELHEKWSYQWIMRLPAFMESSLEVILSLLHPDHGIKIVVFLVWCCVVYQACTNILRETTAFISAWRLRQQFQ